MTLAQIEYALALKEYKNYSKAAKVLGISQPALSIQVKRLEEILEIQLFSRTNKSVELTTKGNIFLSKAALLLNESKQLMNLASTLREQSAGELRIGIIPTLAPYLLPLFIENMAETYPDIPIVIKESLTEEIIRDINAGNLDAGIISTPISSNINYQFIPIFYEGFKLFVSNNHPLFHREEISISDIPVKDVLLLKEGNCLRDQVNNICEIAKKRGGDPLFQFESNSIESLCRIVEFKGGITFLPELTTLHLGEDREDLIKEIAGERKVREISVVHLPGHIRIGDVEMFAQCIRENLPKNLLGLNDAEMIPTSVKV